MIKKAVIVAAGLSSRLYPLTLKKPKGLLPVGNTGLLERSIHILKKNNINDIALVVGFEKEQIVQQFGDTVTYISNPFYQKCNNMGSLWFAKDFVQDNPFVYLHGDIIYTEKLFAQALEHFCAHKNDIELVTDYFYSDEESMKVRCTKEKFLIESNKQIPLDQSDGEWIGLTFVRNSISLFHYIEKIMFNEGLDFYDTHAFTQMARDNHKIFCSSTNSENWVEVDFDKDYQQAKELFG
jgi:choline kinase